MQISKFTAAEQQQHRAAHAHAPARSDWPLLSNLRVKASTVEEAEILHVKAPCKHLLRKTQMFCHLEINGIKCSLNTLNPVMDCSHKRVLQSKVVKGFWAVKHHLPHRLSITERLTFTRHCMINENYSVAKSFACKGPENTDCGPVFWHISTWSSPSISPWITFFLSRQWNDTWPKLNCIKTQWVCIFSQWAATVGFKPLTLGQCHRHSATKKLCWTYTFPIWRTRKQLPIAFERRSSA